MRLNNLGREHLVFWKHQVNQEETFIHNIFQNVPNIPEHQDRKTQKNQECVEGRVKQSRTPALLQVNSLIIKCEMKSLRFNLAFYGKRFFTLLKLFFI